MPDDDYDWADDDTLSAEDTIQIFDTLGTEAVITGPPGRTPALNELTFSYATHTKTETISAPLTAPFIATSELAMAWTA